MLTLKEVHAIISSTGIPTVYRAWPVNEAPALPFICYFETGSNNVVADNVVYQNVKQIAIELYTDTKDEETESKVEAALFTAEIPWDKTESFLDKESCYLILYEIEV